jgi:hypothetical protein
MGGRATDNALVTHLVSHDLPLAPGRCRYSGTTGNLVTTPRGIGLAELTEPGNSNLASTRTVGQQMPETRAVASALGTPPLAEKTETGVEIGPALGFARLVPGHG